MKTSPQPVIVGCAGWSIWKDHADRFPSEGTHLSRYAQRFPAVEVNTSFYHPHRPKTYAKWAAETPEGFLFSVKVPKEITHERRLADAMEPLDRFLDETASLGAKRGPLLVQLPPSLAFHADVAIEFFEDFRRRYPDQLACEPRHSSWFTPEVDLLLAAQRVARVAADPAVVPGAAEPGGSRELTYYRLHGSPHIYYSAYDAGYLDQLAGSLAEAARLGPTWCIFDNTALGAATLDAFTVLEKTRGSSNE